MARSSNNRNTNASGDMSSLPLVAGVGAFMVVCFCVGFFVMGKGFRNTSGSNSTPTLQQVGTSGTTVVQNTPAQTPKGKLMVIDNTAALEAKRKKAEEEAKKKAEEEAKKKAEEEAKKKAEEEKENMASPSPEASIAAPDPDDLPDPSPSPSETPASTDPVPQPSESPVVRPVPSPKPSPVTPSTPDDPEDRAMSSSPVASGPLYRVRVGTFEAKNNAEARAAELRTSGYDTSLFTDVVDGKVVYRLQVAAYRSEKAAREFAREVEAKGFKTTVSRN